MCLKIKAHIPSCDMNALVYEYMSPVLDGRKTPNRYLPEIVFPTQTFKLPFFNQEVYRGGRFIHPSPPTRLQTSRREGAYAAVAVTGSLRGSLGPSGSSYPCRKAARYHNTRGATRPIRSVWEALDAATPRSLTSKLKPTQKPHKRHSQCSNLHSKTRLF